jgi:hypothetical protein
MNIYCEDVNFIYVFLGSHNFLYVVTYLILVILLSYMEVLTASVV